MTVFICILQRWVGVYRAERIIGEFGEEGKNCVKWRV